MEQIFISYRRDDAAGYARAVHDALARELGAERVFMDVEDIAAGQPFGAVIEQAVDGSTVLLVLIGRRWAGPREGAPPRISEPGDFVRREVETALARGMRVVPVLLDGAPMPAEAELPDTLKALAGRQALPLDGSRFTADVQRLLVALRGPHAAAAQPAAPPPAPPAPARRRRSVAVVGAVVAIAAGTLLLATLGRRESPPEPSRPPVNGRWLADVTYPWPNARYTETFEFSGEGKELRGAAGFLRVPRPLAEGRIDAQGLVFSTRTAVDTGERRSELLHRYRGRLAGDTLELEMQTEGGDSPLPALRFTARRAPAAASGPSP